MALGDIAENHRTCSICAYEMSDTGAFYEKLEKAAKMTFAVSLPKQLDRWALRLITHVREVEHAPDRWEKQFGIKRYRAYIKGLICAQYRWIEVAQSFGEEEGCVGAVKLSCGHVFGFACITRVSKVSSSGVPIFSC